MESSINAAWDVVQRFRVPDLQALLEYARLPRQGYKRDLLSRCKVLLTSKWSPQLATKIDEINQARMNSSRNFSWTRHYPMNLPNTQPVVVVTAAPAAVVASPSATDENLPPANHVQFVHLPFFETIRNIECVNMSVNRKAFNPLYFRLNESDINLILKGTARVFLRLAPTIVNQRQHDVIPCYLTVQCNGQVVINNNVGRVVNASAHALMFPHDLTAQIVPKSQAINSLTYYWFHLPQHMGLRNLPLAYTLAIQLVRCVPLDDLCTKILQRPMPVTKLEETKNGRFDVDDLGLMTTRHRVSLLCPITQRMIVQPVKSRLCSHVACFDLQPFLQMNQRRSQWMCPFCKKPAAYDTLHLDGAFKKILDNAPANCTTVEINSSANGSWEDCHYIVDHLKEEKSDPDSSYASKEKDGDEDCVVLSSESEDDDDDDYQDDDDEGSPSQVPTALFTPPFNDVSALSYSIAPDLPEEALWDDIARFTYDYIANEEAQQRRRKRTRSPDSSLSKRHRSSTTSEIAIITLDSSDNENEDHS